MSEILPEPPTLELDQVRLRPLRASDAAALLAYLGDPAVTALTSYPQVTPKLVETMIDRIQRRWAAGELSKWAIVGRQDDQVIGTCGFNEHSLVHRHAELAYDLAAAAWGKGVMFAAVNAVLAWVYGHDLLHRVHAYVRVDNIRSRRLLERSGFVNEGCLRGYRICRGEPRDFAIYGLLRAEWSAGRQHHRSRPGEGFSQERI